MGTVELRIAPLPENVRTARLVAAALARRCGVDEAYVDEVKLAVGEACARAVGVNQAHAPGRKVVVTFADDAPAYVVTVADCGPGGTVGMPGDPADMIDFAALADPSPAPDPAGAPPWTRPLPADFGLAVVAGLVDDVTVTADGDGTLVRMAWPQRRPLASGA